MAGASDVAGLRARLLGPFEIEGVDLAGLRSRKARTLLKVLVLADGRPVSVGRLVDCLWGDAAPAKAEREVAVNASRARSIVGASNIERSDAGYRIRLAWSDFSALAELDDEAQRRLAAGDHVAARAAAGAGLALERGAPLGDEVDPWWAEAELTAVDRMLASLRRCSARAALALGSLGLAASEAERALAADPLDEDALRVLMAAQAGAGRVGSALAAYAGLRARLADELGADPAPETEAVHTAILLEQAIPGLPDVPRTVTGDAPSTTLPTGSDASVSDPPGRTRELETLDRVLEGLDDRPLIVAIDGEAGSGKTTVLDAFGARAERAGAVVLRASCDARGIDLPLEPLAVALAAELGLRDAAERTRVLGADADLLGPLLGVADALAELPGPLPAPDSLRRLLFASIGRVLTRLADGAPLVLLLDDAHHADESTTAWLHHVVRRRDPPMLVALARRTGEPAGDLFTAPDERLTLRPLDLDAAVRIVGDARAADLLERSGGNALFLVELAGTEQDAELPASIRAAVTSRVREPDAARTLQTAAVIGPDIDLDLLAAVLHRSALEVLTHLEAGLAVDLLQERGGHLHFRHGLIVEALAAELSAARRTLIHRDVVAVLSERPGSDPLLVAHHARLAQDDLTAADALAEAAAQAAARLDLSEGERLLTEAIELASSGALLVRRGRIRLARADLDGAEADAVAAVAEAGAPALELRAWVARFRHDMETAIRVGTEAADRADDPTTRASALVAVGLAHRGLGDLTAAERGLTTAIDCEGTGHADLGAKGWLGVLRVHQGRPDEALDLLEPVVGAEVDAVHGFWVEHTLQMTAHAYALTGRVVEAHALLDRLARELDRRGSRVRYAGLVENYRSWILRNLDDPDALDLATAAFEVTGMPEAHTQATLDLADAELRAGRMDAADQLLDRADEAMGIRFFQHRWRCEARRDLLRAHLALARHDAESAAPFAERLVVAAEGRGDGRYLVLARLARDRATAMSGERVDVDRTAADLDRLPHVASLEAWWTAADVARDVGVDLWWRRAETFAEHLALGLGPDAAAFRARVAPALAARRSP